MLKAIFSSIDYIGLPVFIDGGRMLKQNSVSENLTYAAFEARVSEL